MFAVDVSSVSIHEIMVLKSSMQVPRVDCCGPFGSVSLVHITNLVVDTISGVVSLITIFSELSQHASIHTVHAGMSSATGSALWQVNY